VNAPIRRLSVALLLLFGALLVNANYVQVVQASSLNDRSDNRRVLLEEYGRERGPILVGDDQRIVRSRPTDTQLEFLRVYETGVRYAHVTGFYSFVFGRSGIEAAANEVLSGTGPRFFVRSLVDLVTGKEPQGGSVVLTLDPAAQEAAYDALGDRKGAVVALDPATGAVLAMVSKPSFDPNRLASHAVGEQQQAWKRYNADPDRPLTNRAAGELYPPGSVFKLVTAAAALDSGRYTPDGRIPGPAELDLPLTDRTLPNQSGAACGPGGQTTLTEALRISCNTAFAGVGLALGADALAEQAERFGLEDTPLGDLPAAVSRFPDQPDAPQTALSAIGQFDVRVSPLQVAMVSAAIANNGVLMQPHLVREQRTPDLEVLSSTEPQELSQAISAETAEALTAMMVRVVQEGTGTNAQISGIDVAGKTGTAQSDPQRPPYAWFTSFAPADEPRVAVAVLIEDAGVSRSEVSGNSLAAPVARAVMQAVLGS
jgi:peptidoglycan glycosyltransferase